MTKYTRFCITGEVKDVVFMGSAEEDLRRFPEVARQRAGYQLYLVQSGLEPADWRSPSAPLAQAVVRSGYVTKAARFGSSTSPPWAMPCMSCTVFEKKSQRTANADLELGKARYKQMQLLIKETKS